MSGETEQKMNTIVFDNLTADVILKEMYMNKTL